MIRFPALSRRNGVVAVVLLGALGGILGWAGSDRSPPPRQMIAAPNASRPQGFTPDGRSFVTLSPEGFVFWDSATWQPRRPWTVRALPISAFSRDGQTYVGVHGYDYDSAKIAWVDVASGTIRASFAAGLPQVLHLGFSDGDRAIQAFVTDRTDSSLEVVTWDLATGAETRRPIAGPKGTGFFGVRPAGYAHDGRVVAFLDLTRHGVQLWDVATDQPIGGLLRTPSTRLIHFASATFTPGDDRLLVGRSDGTVEIWNLADRRWLRTIPVHPAGFTSVDWQIAPDGRTLASSRTNFASRSWVSRVWTTLGKPLGLTGNPSGSNEAVVVDLQTGDCLARWPGAFHPQFAPDSRTIVTHESWLGKFAVRDAPQVSEPAK